MKHFGKSILYIAFLALLFGCNSTFNIGTKSGNETTVISQPPPQPVAENTASENEELVDTEEETQTDTEEEQPSSNENVPAENEEVIVAGDDNQNNNTDTPDSESEEGTEDQSDNVSETDNEAPPKAPPVLSAVALSLPATVSAGEQLTCDLSISNPDEAAYTTEYQWYQSGTEIVGKTNVSLSLTGTMLGAPLHCSAAIFDSESNLITRLESTPTTVPIPDSTITPTALSLVGVGDGPCSVQHSWNFAADTPYSLNTIAATTSDFGGGVTVLANATQFTIELTENQLTSSSTFTLDTNWSLNPGNIAKLDNFSFSIAPSLAEMSLPVWPSSIDENSILPASGAYSTNQSCIASPRYSSASFRLVTHQCVPNQDGELICWGENAVEELGVNSPASSDTPVKATHYDGLNAGSFVTNVATSVNATCVILANDSVECWGSDANGRLGDAPGTVNSTTPVQVSGLTGSGDANSKAIYIAGAETNFCAILASGRVKCWGGGANNRLGKGSTADSEVPDYVYASSGVPLENVVSISLNRRSGCAIQTSGRAVCWGEERNSNFGNGASGSSSYADSEITGFDGSADPANKAISVDLEFRGGCGIDGNGAVYCWGTDNIYHLAQDGDAVTGQTYTTRNMTADINGTNRKAIKVTVGEYHRCALITDGSVRCWGAGSAHQRGIDCTPDVSGLCNDNPNSNVVAGIDGSDASSFAISLFKRGGYGGTCAIMMDKTTKCWGNLARGDGTGGGIYEPALLRDPDSASALSLDFLPVQMQVTPL